MGETMILNYETATAKFKIEVPSTAVAIYGDNGTGKTLLIKAAKATKAITKDTQLMFFDYSNDSQQLKQAIENNQGKIIFIDNADLFADEEDWEKLIRSNSSNHYIIFTRDFNAWGISLYNASELEQREGFISTRYRLRKHKKNKKF